MGMPVVDAGAIRDLTGVSAVLFAAQAFGGHEQESGLQAAVQTIIAQNRMANLAKNAKEGSAHGKAAYMSSPEEIERMTEPAR